MLTVFPKACINQLCRNGLCWICSHTHSGQKENNTPHDMKRLCQLYRTHTVRFDYSNCTGHHKILQWLVKKILKRYLSFWKAQTGDPHCSLLKCLYIFTKAKLIILIFTVTCLNSVLWWCLIRMSKCMSNKNIHLYTPANFRLFDGFEFLKYVAEDRWKKIWTLFNADDEMKEQLNDPPMSMSQVIQLCKIMHYKFIH